MALLLGIKTRARKSNRWRRQGSALTVKCCEGVPSAMIGLDGKKRQNMTLAQSFFPAFHNLLSSVYKIRDSNYV